MLLQDLIEALENAQLLKAKYIATPELLHRTVHDLYYDSRKVKTGGAFFALPGRTLDGTKFLSAAQKAGALCLIAECPSETLPGLNPRCYLEVSSARLALAELAALFFDEPSKKLKVIGITGTKGKSSVAHLIYTCLKALGKEPLLIGTTGIHFQDKRQDSPNTTPESYLIQKHMKDALDFGATHLVIELSSQALEMHRAHALNLELAIFTNLSRDHIGPKEHHDFQSYREAKAKIFSLSKRALLNFDDDAASKMAARCPSYEGFTIDPLKANSKIHLISHIESDSKSICFDFLNQHLELSPAADYLMENAACCLLALKMLGFSLDLPASLLPDIAIPGRLESIANTVGATILIDYAHNKTSMEHLLAALKATHPQRLIVLFGAVGGKSKERRKELAEATERYADLTIVTSDNPEDEDPLSIIQEIAQHYSENFNSYILEPDRKRALEQAVALLKPGDCLALCGKGHEDFQLIQGKKIPLNERLIVEEALKKKSSING